MTRRSALAANTGLMAGSVGSYRRWRKATERVAEAQLSRLQDILRRNIGTCFGREHHFRDIGSFQDYHKLVPLRSYTDFEPYIQRITGGESNVLTAEPVLLFEPSSGSTSASKLVPYTRSLEREFQQGIGPWLCATYAAWPGLLAGQQYWSISPAGASQTTITDGGIPIGFEDDGQYFGSHQRRFIEALLAVPPAVRHIPDLETFRYVTLRFLLQCRDLSLVSVWHPTFLTLLLESLHSHAPSLLSDLAAGALNPPNLEAPLSKSGVEGILDLQRHIERDPGRARQLGTLLDASGGDPRWRDHGGRSLYECIWPRLQLISSWADGPAAQYSAHLQMLFPSTAVQPKGLLATEGMVSFPLGCRSGAALSINSHFFEFIDVEGAGGAPRLAHELNPGRTYSVVITTGGGLYRYRLHDLVEVTGYVNQCPLIRFLAKEDAVVDLFGEKLSETHVRREVTAQLALLGQPPKFWLVAPEQKEEHPASYTLFVQWECPDVASLSEESLKTLAAGVEQALRENYHYRYCRELGQLDPLRVFLIEADSGDAAQRFLEVCNSRGQRLGDVKPAGLHSFTGWAEVFPGRYISTASRPGGPVLPPLVGGS